MSLSRSSRPFGQPDYWIPVLAFGLAIFGVAMISSASALVAFSNSLPTHYYFTNQLIALLISTVVFFFTASIPFRWWRKLSVLLLLASIIGLILVFIPGIGAEYGTARSWIVVPLLGSFQPVEFTKLALVIYLASWMAGREHEIHSFQKGFIPFSILMIASLLLVVLQPDFGSILVILLTAATMYFVGGANIWHLLGGAGAGAVLATFVIMSKDYVKKRFLTFLDPSLDPEGIGYHIKQILIAVGSGGWWGLGFGRSRQKYQYLPEPQADSIMAVAAEELGFIRVSFILIAIGALIWRGFRAAWHAPDRFGFLLATGITTWIAVQSVLNIAVNVSAAPMTGVPLPFISHGGSSLMMLFAGVGILFSISRESQVRQQIGRSRTNVKLRSQLRSLQTRMSKLQTKLRRQSR